MYLIINGEKGSYDRPINIVLDSSYPTAYEAGAVLKDTLVGWLLHHENDDDLLVKCDYDYDKYRNKLKTGIKTRITKAVNANENWIYYNDYDYYSFNTDAEGNLTMITTGCPSDNEYDGETYQVIYI